MQKRRGEPRSRHPNSREDSKEVVLPSLARPPSQCAIFLKKTFKRAEAIRHSANSARAM